MLGALARKLDPAIGPRPGVLRVGAVAHFRNCYRLRPLPSALLYRSRVSGSSLSRSAAPHILDPRRALCAAPPGCGEQRDPAAASCRRQPRPLPPQARARGRRLCVTPGVALCGFAPGVALESMTPVAYLVAQLVCTWRPPSVAHSGVNRSTSHSSLALVPNSITEAYRAPESKEG